MRNNHFGHQFPADFLWGSAISSHQVEGDNINDWTEWEESPSRHAHLHKHGHIKKYGLDNFLSRRAARHHHLYKDDHRLAKDLGHNALRLSLEWSRIEPTEGVFDEEAIRHYRTMIRHLKEQGIEPLVTLWHWTIPLWLRDKGGWQSRQTPEYFNRYVRKVVGELRDEVTVWVTLNEPEIYTLNSYLTGVWPPQKKNPLAYWQVIHNLVRGHKLAYATIHELQPTAQVGIAKNNIYFEPHQNLPINRLIKKACDWWWNFYFLNHLRGTQDFIGLNYYFHNRIHWAFGENENKVVSDLGWELHPEGIYHVLVDLKRYNKPIYITENGLADATDEKRTWFITNILKFTHQAIQEGVNVKGYLHWSLIDNFEWDKGFFPRFGLVEVDFETMERKPRASALVYRDIIKNKGI